MAVAVRELPLDLDAFEGPFDLLLTLVLREELELRDVDVAEIVLAFVERCASADELDLEACGEFLVLVAALLELKARGLFPGEELDLEGLDPEEAAEELAERLAAYRRFRAAAGWLEERLAARVRPLLPPRARRRSRRRPSRPVAQQDPGAARRRARARSRRPPPEPSLRPPRAHLPAARALPRALPLAPARARPLRLRQRGRPALARRADRRLPRPARAAQAQRGADRAGRPLRADHGMERLRLVENPVDRLARTIEALLVIASKPLSVAELAAATEEEEERVETALGLIAGRFREGRSGIVLEHVAGGYAFRAAREAADACARLVERPVQRGLTQAALETLAVVAYLGPVSRPEIARIRGVAADSAVAGLVERGLIAEAGREPGGRRRPLRDDAALRARLRARPTARELPELDELAGDVEELRARLEDVARRPA